MIEHNAVELMVVGFPDLAWRLRWRWLAIKREGVFWKFWDIFSNIRANSLEDKNLVIFLYRK